MLLTSLGTGFITVDIRSKHQHIQTTVLVVLHYSCQLYSDIITTTTYLNVPTLSLISSPTVTVGCSGVTCLKVVHEITKINSTVESCVFMTNCHMEPLPASLQYLAQLSFLPLWEVKMNISFQAKRYYKAILGAYDSSTDVVMTIAPSVSYTHLTLPTIYSV